ncbi:hypothetical protein Sjap_008046 [Stephania japonica]|uniref:Uncharacterized protein n=1 Tax=Stephania japonica TaxID=461633 RepID=A0AAP0PAZ8_9MAGN
MVMGGLFGWTIVDEDSYMVYEIWLSCSVKETFGFAIMFLDMGLELVLSLGKVGFNEERVGLFNCGVFRFGEMIFGLLGSALVGGALKEVALSAGWLLGDGLGYTLDEADPSLADGNSL